MGFRFRRVLTLFPGVHLNISKGGISLSLGGAPITFTSNSSRSTRDYLREAARVMPDLEVSTAC